MNDFVVVLTVVGLFLLRIGIPLILLMVIGTLIERHQERQRAEMLKIHKMYEQMEQVEDTTEAEIQKAA